MDGDDRPTISGRSGQVREQFRELLKLVGLEQNDASSLSLHRSIEDAMHRFALWGGNLGAFRQANSKLSLDSRLSAADGMDIREEILRQLDDIDEGVQHLEHILQSPENSTGSPTEEDDAEINRLESDVHEGSIDTSDDGPIDEVSVIMDIINQSITSLLRIGVLVRKASPRDKFKEALRATRLPFPDIYDIEHVRVKYPKLKEIQYKRLGRAIANRRQFIMYCRDHRARLGHEDTEDGRVNAGTEVLSSKASTFQAPAQYSLLSLQDEEEDDDAVSIMSASTVSDDSVSPLKLPLLADLSPNDEPFECPICFTLQSFKNERAWQNTNIIPIRHAFRDLKAYVCTYGDKKCDDSLFGDRESWFEHEMVQHRALYRCPLCDRIPPASAQELRLHLVEEHGHFSDQQLLALGAVGKDTHDTFMAHDCPFCNGWAVALWSRKNPKGKAVLQDGAPPAVKVSAKRFKRHVARHHEQLAIFAMPRHLEDVAGPDWLSSRSSVVEYDEEAEAEEDQNTVDLAEFPDLPDEAPAPETQDVDDSETGLVDNSPETLHIYTGSSDKGKYVWPSTMREQSESPEILKMKAELEAYREEQRKKREVEKQSELEGKIRKDTEEALVRELETMKLAQEKLQEEIAEARREAEQAVYEALEARRKALEEERQMYKEAAIRFAKEAAAKQVVKEREEETINPSTWSAMPPRQPANAELEARQKLEKEKEEEASLVAAAGGAGEKAVNEEALEKKVPEETKAELEAEAKNAAEKAPIKFQDAVGRKFSFPFHLCQTWAGMEEIIKQAFSNVDDLGPRVQRGMFDLIGPNGEIILPHVWDKVIEPGWQITMAMWPVDIANVEKE